MAGSPEAAAGVSTAAAGDPAGASPGESLADATGEPHAVTTPDAPAEDIAITEDPTKKI